MSLRHALLGLLAIRPATGYELTQRFDATLRNAWHASHSQIYPELGRMEELGMVEVVGQGARNSRTWAVTDTGREEVRRWLTQTEPNRSVRSEGAVRFFLIGLLEPSERRAVLERDLAYVEQEAAGLEAVARDIEAAGGSPFAPVVDLGRRMDALMRAWLLEQLDETRER